MFWNIIFPIASILIGTLAVIVAIVSFVKLSKLKIQPIQKERVKILLDVDYYHYSKCGSIFFEFPDSSKKEIDVKNSVYEKFEKSDTGMLTYQIYKNKISAIRFEKHSDCEESKIEIDKEIFSLNKKIGNITLIVIVFILFVVLPGG